MIPPRRILTQPHYRADRDAARAGGKGARLFELAGAGANVPAFFCVSTDVFADVQTGLTALLAEVETADRSELASVSERLRGAIAERGVPPADASAIRSAAADLFGADTLVAVRSSVVGEDSATDSFAGLMDTYLYVPIDEIVDKVAACMASAYTERALDYRRTRGQDQPIRAAVVVQSMVDSEVAGVAFTINPMTGDPGEAVVTAALGLGEGVVSGIVEADTFFYDRERRQTSRREIATQTSRVVLDQTGGSGTRIEPVSASEPVLDDDKVRRIVELGELLERDANRPQDLEWAFVGDELYLLQARPVTAVNVGRETILDNSNIVENYPGLTLPLTYSYVRDGYAEIFGAALEILGVDKGTIEAHQWLLDDCVALADGRLYYNILNWYRGYQFLHLERALPAWESALGIDTDKHRPPVPTRMERLRRAPQTARMRIALVSQLATLQRRADRFLARIDELGALMKQTDLDAMDAHAVLDMADRWLHELRGPYAVSVINDMIVQQGYDFLCRVLRAWGLTDPEALRNDLLCGLAGMHSVAPLTSLLSLAERVRDEPALAELFARSDDRAVWDAIQTDDRFRDFRDQALRHLEAYGDRTLEELKLEVPSLSDTPDVFVSMLRNYARGPRRGGVTGREEQVRSRAEALVRRHLRRHPLRRATFELLLRITRAAVVNRENLRLARTRVVGASKSWYGALGRKLAQGGLIESWDDIFYLTVDEVDGAVNGHLVMRDLKGVVELRKRDYEQFAQQSLAPRIAVRGAVYLNQFPSPAAVGELDGAVLKGLGSSGGRVRAPAKVVLEPRSDLEVRGEILVAPMTDPGWVFLMATAGGLIVEKGSLLSHTAIIGRELGIPTVLGIAGATELIRDGETLELDGSAGTVRLVDREGGN